MLFCQAWSAIREQILSKPLLSDLREIKQMLESVLESDEEIELSTKLGSLLDNFENIDNSTSYDTLYTFLADLTLVSCLVTFQP